MVVKKFKREFESKLDIPGSLIKRARVLGKSDEVQEAFALAYVLELRAGTFEANDENDVQALARYMDTYGLRRVQEVVPVDEDEDDDLGK